MIRIGISLGKNYVKTILKFSIQFIFKFKSPNTYFIEFIDVCYLLNNRDYQVYKPLPTTQDRSHSERVSKLLLLP